MTVQQTPSKASAALALVEVVSVFAAGSILGLLIARIVGAPLVNPLEALAQDPSQDLLPLTVQLLQILFWQYLGWLICGGVLFLLRRARVPRAKAEKPPAMPWHRLLLLGLACGALVTLPAHAIHWTQATLDIGDTAPWRQALLDREWSLDFWIFTAAGSFLLIPIIEEAFYRGYVLGRLDEALPSAGAAMFTAGLFAFAHSQYLQADLLNALTLAGVVWGGLVYAAVTLYTRSLAPAIIAHAIINVPLKEALYTYTIPALAIAALAVVFLARGLREFTVAMLRKAPLSWLALAIAGAGFSTLFHWQTDLVALGAIGVWLLLCLYHLARLVFRRRTAA
jgi:membrane protease YdiL (CAAX protease family)